MMRVSIERLAEIWRATDCRMLSTDREVSVADIEELESAGVDFDHLRFGAFLEHNKRALQVYEEGA